MCNSNIYMEILKYIVIIFPFTVFSQSIRDLPIPRDVSIYSYNRFGVKDNFPSVIIDGKGDLYTVNRFGVIENLPSKHINEEGEVFNYNRYGVREVLPTAKIETNEIQNETQTRVHTTRTRTVRREFGRRQE